MNEQYMSSNNYKQHIGSGPQLQQQQQSQSQPQQQKQQQTQSQNQQYNQHYWLLSFILVVESYFTNFILLRVSWTF